MAKLRFVHRPKLTDLSDFLRYHFNTDEQVEQAQKILTMLKKEKEIADTEWRKFVVQSVGLYTKVMRTLRDFGLVEKRNGYFQLSKEYIYSLKKMITYWEDYTS